MDHRPETLLRAGGCKKLLVMEAASDAVSSESVEKAAQQSAEVHNKDRLAACLACDICGEVLKDPMVSPDCMHR